MNVTLEGFSKAGLEIGLSSFQDKNNALTIAMKVLHPFTKGTLHSWLRGDTAVIYANIILEQDETIRIINQYEAQLAKVIKEDNDPKP